MSEKAQFLTSDLHLGHVNIIEYCNRPYKDVPEMNADLVERWNSMVSPEDEVFIIGDLAMGRLDDSLVYVGLLNGTKHLVPGNHDRMFGCQGTKHAHAVQRYVDAGIADVLDDQIVLELIPSFHVVVNHFPYQGDSQDGHEDRFQDRRPNDLGNRLVHGHCHGQWRRNNRMIDVGVDAWGGYPVTFGDVVDLFLADDLNAVPLAW
jgi:calcineurin-like phosphoesterase family protein